MTIRLPGTFCRFPERNLVRSLSSCHLCHLAPIFRKVLRKNYTRKKIPEMTLNVTQVTRFSCPTPKNQLHQISPKNFPGTFPKNLSGTRNERTVRDFPKMPHRIFREDSCIQSQPHAADPASKPLLALFFRLPLVTVSHSYRKKVDLIPALDDGDRPDIEILAPVTGILRPGNIHPTVRVSGLCKTGPHIDQVVTDRICYVIRRNRDLE